MSEQKLKPEELTRIDFSPRSTDWLDARRTELKKGCFNYAAIPQAIEYLGQPNPRKWQPMDDDWQLPDDWMQTLHDGMIR